MFHHSRIVAIPGIGALFLLLSGCSDPASGVTGKVTYQGVPVTEGSIGFSLRSKGIAQDAELDSAGAFVMAAPMPPGTYQVYYVPPIPIPPGSSKAGKTLVVKSVVPKKYHTVEASNVSFEVKAGSNDISIDFKE